jgi:hypothetical protein
MKEHQRDDRINEFRNMSPNGENGCILLKTTPITAPTMSEDQKDGKAVGFEKGRQISFRHDRVTEGLPDVGCVLESRQVSPRHGTINWLTGIKNRAIHDQVS